MSIQTAIKSVSTGTKFSFSVYIVHKGMQNASVHHVHTVDHGIKERASSHCNSLHENGEAIGVSLYLAVHNGQGEQALLKTGNQETVFQ